MNYPNGIIPTELSQWNYPNDGKTHMTKFDPQSHHRRSIRLKGYDYTTPGAYFITLVSWQRENIFGEILDGRIELNKFGQITKQQWEKLPCRFPHIDLDEFAIMPIISMGSSSFPPEVGEKVVDLGGSRVVRMVLIVKKDEAASPIYVGSFRAGGVVPRGDPQGTPYGLPQGTPYGLAPRGTLRGWTRIHQVKEPCI